MILRKEKILCMSCMEEHEVAIVCEKESNIFKGIELEYDATYYYCDKSEEYYADEEMMSANDISMKNAYRQKMGMLTSNEICSIRKKYGITQTDLALILGWGEKTITRYESHQVQEAVYDSVLRKIDKDPEWYLDLLKKNKDKISSTAFNKYYEIATKSYENNQDEYLRKSIAARYVRFEGNPDYNGSTILDLDKVVDVIRYFSNAKEKVTALFKVKLMKLLWYADNLFHKRYGKSMTGLVYMALPMGAVPVCHDLIIDLKGIHREDVEFEENSGYHFLPTQDKTYPHLTKEEMLVLDEIINKFGKQTKTNIVNYMHKEKAYTETCKNGIIEYKYTKYLSLE